MKMNENYENLICFVRAALTGEKADIPAEKINFSAVYEISAAHCITAPVYCGIKQCGIDIPDEIKKKFISAEKVMTVSCVARNEASNKVFEELKNNDIDCLLFKGTLFQNMYPKKHMRYSADTDILVKSDDYTKACSLIKNLGFYHDSKNDKHDVFLKKPFVCIEVHGKLASEEDFFLSVWENCERISDNLYKMNTEFELTYLLYHMKEDFVRSAGMGIHSVCDLWLYLKKYGEKIDENILKTNLTQLGIHKFYLSMKELCEIWFEGKELNEFYRDLSELVISGSRGGNAVNAASLKMDGEKNIFFGKVKFIIKKIFLPYKDLKKIYPALGKFPPALPFFWLMRITGIIFRPEHRGFSRASKVMKYANKERISKVKGVFAELEIDK